jgi:hypothetical protein
MLSEMVSQLRNHTIEKKQESIAYEFLTGYHSFLSNNSLQIE